jgi:hypothetical protein
MRASVTNDATEKEELTLRPHWSYPSAHCHHELGRGEMGQRTYSAQDGFYSFLFSVFFPFFYFKSHYNLNLGLSFIFKNKCTNKSIPA